MKCPGCGGRELEPDGEGLLRCEGCGEIIDGGPAWDSFAAAPAEPASETAVAPPHGNAPVADHALQQWQAAVRLHGTPGRTLLLASQEIERLADVLRLPTRVRESALELFSEALRRKLVRGRQTDFMQTEFAQAEHEAANRLATGVFVTADHVDQPAGFRQQLRFR